jgi:hypothetical protein
MRHIVGIALLDEDSGVKVTAPIGRGHDHIIKLLTQIGADYSTVKARLQPGFVDNNGRFLDRLEAGELAKANGQAHSSYVEGGILSNQVGIYKNKD